MASHLFPPLPCKPPPPPSTPKHSRSSAALHTSRSDALPCVAVRGAPSSKAPLQVRRSSARPPRHRAGEDEVPVPTTSLKPTGGPSPSKAQAQPQPHPHPSSLYSAPCSREEAISQARSCLAAALLKSGLSPARKVKKQKQPRYRIEIPVLNDSPKSAVEFAFEVFSDLDFKRKDLKPRMLLLWPSPSLQELANQTFSKCTNSMIHSQLGSTSLDVLSSSDLAVVLAPGKSQLDEISTLVEALSPKPVILFNPKWAFDDEKDFNRGSAFLLRTFDVVYSFTGLEIRWILSNRKGVVLRCARDGWLSGEPWVVMVEGDKGEMKAVSTFAKRPSSLEVETLLYNLTAANSPFTKWLKIVTDFVNTVVKYFR